MRSPEKPHFSARALDLAERTQRAIGHTKLGGAVINFATGSNSPAYRQLDWFSQNISSEIKSSVTAPGNPKAAKLARNWNTALIMATETEELADLIADAGSGNRDAVAFISEGVVHVGVHPNRYYLLHNNTCDEDATIAMRIGRGPLEATMGIWQPDDLVFTSVENLQVVEASIDISGLPAQYPGINLV